MIIESQPSRMARWASSPLNALDNRAATSRLSIAKTRYRRLRFIQLFNVLEYQMRPRVRIAIQRIEQAFEAGNWDHPTLLTDAHAVAQYAKQARLNRRVRR